MSDKISKANLSEMAGGTPPGGVSGNMTAADFLKLKGERFDGLRILTLEEGQAAGPFILVQILKNQDLTPEGKKKKMEPVDVYVGKDKDLREVRMPIAASFVGKAKDSRLTLGDTFFVMRTEDYWSKTAGKDCKAYALNITARAAKE